MDAYRLIRSPRKSIAIEIRPDGEVWVRAPLHASKVVIEALLTQKEAWITQNRETMLRLLQADSPPRFLAGESFLYLGKEFTLTFSNELESVSLGEGIIVLPEKDRSRARDVLMGWYKTEARRILIPLVDQLGSRVGTTPTRVRLSNASKRWGSCSASGTLSLNWRLVMTPPKAMTYVIFHELAHTLIPNHSRAFWKLVASWQEDYQVQRTWLKEMGKRIFQF
uniref:M48 family peptidase n=1 Tax=Anaerolinea thermolimosa TaxID=229919 RepID=A0A7C4PGQ8_9CHLR